MFSVCDEGLSLHWSDPGHVCVLQMIFFIVLVCDNLMFMRHSLRFEPPPPHKLCQNQVTYSISKTKVLCYNPWLRDVDWRCCQCLKLPVKIILYVFGHYDVAFNSTIKARTGNAIWVNLNDFSLCVSNFYLATEAIFNKLRVCYNESRFFAGCGGEIFQVAFVSDYYDFVCIDKFFIAYSTDHMSYWFSLKSINVILTNCSFSQPVWI